MVDMIKKALILLISVLFVFGCSKPEDEKSDVILERDLYSVDPDCTSLQVPYQLEPQNKLLPDVEIDHAASSWVSVVDVTAKQIVFSLTKNDTDCDRIARVALVCGSGPKHVLRIVQIPYLYDSQIILSATSQTVEAAATEFKLRCSITGEGAGQMPEVEIPDENSWIQLKKIGSGAAEFSLQPNSEKISRSVKLRFTYPGAKDAYFTLVQAADLLFFISVSDITPSRATLNFKPKDKKMTYAYSVETKETFDGMGNVAYIKAYAEALYKLADENHVTFGSLLASGDVLNKKIENLIDGTDYYALAFDINSEGWSSGEVTLHAFKTPKATPSDNKISFEVMKDGTVKVKTTNSDPYIFDVWDIDSWSEFATPMDQAKRFVEYMKGFEGAIDTYTHRGDYSENYSQWLTKGKNVAFAFGYNEGITTEVFFLEFDW